LLAVLVILLAAAVPALAPTLPGLSVSTAEGEAEYRDQHTSHRKFTNHSIFPSWVEQNTRPFGPKLL
jgi:hypothetical protein